MKPQRFTDLPMEAYLASPHFGSSDLRTFLSSVPAMVKWRRENREDHNTDATILGTAAHTLCIQPELFAGRYALKPAGMRFSTTEGKAWKAEKLAAGVKEADILTDDCVQAVLGVQKALLAKPEVCRVLAEARKIDAIENTLLWHDTNGLPRKARPDFWIPTSTVDLKVSIHATKDLRTLRYQCYRQGWMFQQASGRAGLRACGFDKVATGKLIVVAPEPPHHVWLLEIPEHEMDVLELELENISRDMAPHWRADNWPGTPEDWIEVKVPSDAWLADVEDVTGTEEVPSNG